MSTTRLILYIVFMIICVALTFIVLAQEGKSAGLGAISGMADTYWGKNKGRSIEGKLEKITKILTVEASGIAIAAIVAQYFDVPVVFAKKTLTINLDGSMYTTKIESFTHKRTYDVIVSRKYLGPEDRVLVIDDFLANGCAVTGLIDIIEEAGASLAGVGIIIEKATQDGGKRLRERGVRVESLAIIEDMDPSTGEITFRHQ